MKTSTMTTTTTIVKHTDINKLSIHGGETLELWARATHPKLNMKISSVDQKIIYQLPIRNVPINAKRFVKGSNINKETPNDTVRLIEQIS